jgi:hypothetical protein
MAKDKKFPEALSAIQTYIKEEFLDMTDPGDLSDKDLIDLDNSMGELSRAVMHILGLEIIEAKSGTEFIASISLQSTETLDI